MTPQEITDHKFRWYPGTTVTAHSDIVKICVTWCKLNIEQHSWQVPYRTGPYEHSFRFEFKADAKSFRDQFEPYTDMK